MPYPTNRPQGTGVNWLVALLFAALLGWVVWVVLAGDEAGMRADWPAQQDDARDRSDLPG